MLRMRRGTPFKRVQKLVGKLCHALIGIPGSGVQDWGDFEFAIYNANSAYTDEQQIKEALTRGCRVNLFTVNDPQQMIRFRKAGVDKLITDYPQILKDLNLQETL